MKGILKDVSDFINKTYEGHRDADRAIELIEKLNEMHKDDSIEIIKKLCPHSVLIEEKSID